MKYHKHIIMVVAADLGEDDPRDNKLYIIYNSDKKKVGEALTLGTAKEFIDSGYDQRYL